MYGSMLHARQVHSDSVLCYDENIKNNIQKLSSEQENDSSTVTVLEAKMIVSFTASAEDQVALRICGT